MPMPSLLRYLPLVLGFVATFAAAGGVHQPASSNSLQSLLAPLASLSADFRQVISDGEGYEIQALTGTMDVARPGKVYWKSAPPYEQLVVSDATTLWLYDADLEQVTVRPFDHDIARTPAVLFIGDVQELDDKFRVSSLDTDGGTTYTLVPVDEGALYQRLTLTFKGATPTAMTLWDTLGQQTRIDFSNVKLNQPVADSRFTFAIPDGVDVLYDE